MPPSTTTNTIEQLLGIASSLRQGEGEEQPQRLFRAGSELEEGDTAPPPPPQTCRPEDVEPWKLTLLWKEEETRAMLAQRAPVPEERGGWMNWGGASSSDAGEQDEETRHDEEEEEEEQAEEGEKEVEEEVEAAPEPWWRVPTLQETMDRQVAANPQIFDVIEPYYGPHLRTTTYQEHYQNLRYASEERRRAPEMEQQQHVEAQAAPEPPTRMHTRSQTHAQLANENEDDDDEEEEEVADQLEDQLEDQVEDQLDEDNMDIDDDNNTIINDPEPDSDPDNITVRHVRRPKLVIRLPARNARNNAATAATAIPNPPAILPASLHAAFRTIHRTRRHPSGVPVARELSRTLPEHFNKRGDLRPGSELLVYAWDESVFEEDWWMAMVRKG